MENVIEKVNVTEEDVTTAKSAKAANAVINDATAGTSEEKEFKGTLKEVINEMLIHGTDNCEVTHTLGDVTVVVEVNIQKVIKAGEVLFDATSYDESEDVEVVSFDEDDIERMS
jgi:hypothetical protein